MVAKQEYHDIPGTWVFDAQMSRVGYNLNKVPLFVDEGGKPRSVPGR